MNMLNQIIIEGNVETDAVVESGIHGDMMKFPISTLRFYKNTDGERVEEKDIFDIVAYGDMCEVVGSLKKGKGVRVVGRLKQSVWENKSGKKVSKVFIIAEHIEIKIHGV